MSVQGLGLYRRMQEFAECRPKCVGGGRGDGGAGAIGKDRRAILVDKIGGIVEDWTRRRCDEGILDELPID